MSFIVLLWRHETFVVVARSSAVHQPHTRSLHGDYRRKGKGKLYNCFLKFRPSGGDCARLKSLDEDGLSQTLADDGLWRLAQSCG